jgi:hypothetical protein
MKSSALLCLVLLAAGLAACAGAPTAYRQAAPAFVPVEAPPAYTPGFAPGTPGEPVYTPPGAGLPMPGQPGYGTPQVPRSPNKRALPDDYSPQKEPGLWAADGAPVAIARRQLWGVVVPLPAEMTDEVEYEAWNCSMEVEDVAGSKADAVLRAFPTDALRCAVAIAQHHCAISEAARAKRRHERGEELDPDRARLLAAVEAHTAKLKAAWCAGVVLTNRQRDALEAVLYAWDRAVKAMEPR